MLSGLWLVAGAAEQCAEAEVAVGGQRAHAEFAGPGEGLGIVPLGWLQVGRISMRSDVAEEAPDPRLVAPLLLPVCEVESAPSDRDRVGPAAGREVRLAEIGQEKRMAVGARCFGVRERLLHEGHAFREAA